MASLGLAQIDENTSLVQTGGNDSLVLPNLLKSSVPQFDSVGEKTPEIWPRRVSFGDCTPEGWPKTPTPQDAVTRSRSGFALGDQTPEAWPEFAPSFRIDAQQPVNYQDTPMIMPNPVISGVPSLMPLWPGQVACPLGVVFNGNFLNVNMAVPQSAPTPPPPLYNAAPFSAADKAPAPKAPADSGTSKFKPVGGGKKPSNGAHPDGDADDACPVAVYVDLSALRERGGPIGRGGCRRR